MHPHMDGCRQRTTTLITSFPFYLKPSHLFMPHALHRI